MKKVFLESHNLRNLYSGFGQFNFHLINALSKLDFSPLQITINASSIEDSKEIWGNKFLYKKYNSLQRLPIFRIKENFDLWHSMNQNTKVEPFHKNTPYLLTVHDLHFMEEKIGKEKEKSIRLFKQKMDRSNAISYISNYVKSQVHQHFSVPNVEERVIYNGNTINADKYSEKSVPNFPLKKPYLFTIGEIREKKNLKVLLPMLAKLTPDLHLYIAGRKIEPYTTAIEEKVKELGLQNRVHLLGRITEEEKYQLYRNAEAFVFPSLREGFGIPPIEAMNFNVPIFLSNNTSLPEIGGDAAFYWDHYEPSYMAEVYTKGMRQFLENSAIYKERYLQRLAMFSWDNAAREYISLYRSIISKEI